MVRTLLLHKRIPPQKDLSTPRRMSGWPDPLGEQKTYELLSHKCYDRLLALFRAKLENDIIELQTKSHLR
jgi:hypothetical protein